ncbi:MAG: hypothetical protein Q8877_03180, partial [Sweet potato little leaf phytoplasma]|nr:hypothetical protein [Sweet potato little leaf phytoplasma]
DKPKVVKDDYFHPELVLGVYDKPRSNFGESDIKKNRIRYLAKIPQISGTCDIIKPLIKCVGISTSNNLNSD